MARLAAVLGVLLLGATQEATLDSVLGGMESRAAAVRDLRARFTYTARETNARTKETVDVVRTRGALVVKGGDARWTAREEHGQPFADWLDPKQGFQAALDSNGLVLHAPSRLEAPEDRSGQDDPAHHGASYFVSRFGTAPHTVPLLAENHWLHPVPFLYELAPKRYLAALPNLKLAAMREKDGRRFHVLTAARTDNGRAAREAEALGGLHESWLGGELWIDARDFSLVRILFRYEASASGPPHQTEREFVFARREGAAGIATAVTWGSATLALAEVKINAGVTDDEVRLAVPKDRIARDWNRRAPEVYRKELQQAPDDPSRWLSLGSVLMRHQDWKGASEAFQKVVALRPEAEEGYLALAFLLQQEETLAAATEVLEKGAARVRCAAVYVALAHREAKSDPAKAERHFHEALKIAGDDPLLLAEMLSTISVEDPGPLYLRAFKAELRHGPAPNLFRMTWGRYPRPAEEREALVRIYEDAIAGGRAEDWVRDRIIELYVGLKRPADARRHALASLKALEAAPELPDPFYFLQALDALMAGKDFDAARRVLKLLAAKEGGKPGVAYLRTEARIAAFEKTIPDLVDYWEKSVRPEWKAGDKYRWSPRANALIWALRDANRVAPFMEALLERVGPEPDQQPAADLAEELKTHVFGSEWARLNAALKEKKSGKPATVDDLLGVCNQNVSDKNWKEAGPRIQNLLAREDLTPEQRARALLLRAQWAEAQGDRAAALDSCDRVLAIPTLVGWTPKEARMIRGRLCWAAGDGKGATEAYAAALRQAVASKNLDDEREVLEAVRKRAGTVELVDGEDPATRAIVALTLRDSTKAAAIFTAVCSAWPDDPFFLRELVRTTSEAGLLDEAVAARKRFAAALGKLGRTSARVPYSSESTHDVARGFIRAGDVAAMKKFAEALLAEPRWSDSYVPLMNLLASIGEGPYLEQSLADMVRKSTHPVEKLNAHHLAANVWHSLGETEKATALLAEISEKNGWPAGHVESTRKMTVQLETEGRKRKELFAEWARKLSELGEEEDEGEVLDRLLRDSQRRREFWGAHADLLWKSALRSARPDPLLLKIGAIRDADRRIRAACIEKLEAGGDARPEWSARGAFLALTPAGGLQLTEQLLARIKDSAPSPARRDRMGRLLAENRWQLTGEQRVTVGRALEAAGSFRWAWAFLADRLEESNEVLPFAEKWRDVAAAGQERAEVRLLIANALLKNRDVAKALAEIEAAAGEPKVDAGTRTRIDQLHLQLLSQSDRFADFSAALLRWLRLHQFGAAQVERATWLVLSNGGQNLEGFLDDLEAAAQNGPASPGFFVFRARLQQRAGRSAAVLTGLEQGGRRFPKDALLWRELALARFLARDWAGAAEAYESLPATAGDPQLDWVYHYHLAQCYGRLGRPAAALEHLRAIEKTPRADEMLASLAAELGLTEEAIRLYRSALDVKKDGSLRLRLAEALRSAGRLPEAEAELRGMIESEEGLNYSAARRLVEILPAEGRDDQLVPILLDKVRKARDLPRALLIFESFAGVIPADGRESLSKAWERLTEKETVDERFALITARIRRHWGRTPLRALDGLATALKTFPESVHLHLEAAQHHAALGRRAEAAAAYENVARLDPKGTVSGVAVAVHLREAFWNHLQAQDGPAALRTGFALLEGRDLEATERDGVRRGLASVAEALADDLWGELRRLRLKPAPAADAEHLSRQIELLSNDDIRLRRAAAVELQRLDWAALPALLPLIESRDPELQASVRQVIVSILRK